MFFEKHLILIVDDEPRNLQLLGNVLDHQGYDIAMANNGSDSLKFLKNEIPSLILLDVLMPEMNGFEVCRQIKANNRTKDIPVIFLTAKSDGQSILEGFTAGGVDYITKPFRQEELLTRIQNHLKLSSTIIENKELLHILCHDLKNPLNAVSGLLEISETAEELAEIKENLISATDSCLAIVELVRKMQELDKLALELENISLFQAIQSSLVILDSRLKQKKITVQCHVNKNFRVIAEKISLIHSVINNLITNAVKFSYPDSSITIKAWEKNNWTYLSIIDHGIGMPQAIVDQLFHFTKNTSRTGTAKERGMGFGMPLLYKFINHYGGSVEVISKDKNQFNDHGTTITIKFKSGEKNNDDE